MSPSGKAPGFGPGIRGSNPSIQPDATAEFETYVPHSAFASAKREILAKRVVYPTLFV